MKAFYLGHRPGFDCLHAWRFIAADVHKGGVKGLVLSTILFAWIEHNINFSGLTILLLPPNYIFIWGLKGVGGGLEGVAE